jgi:hypothetical protein
VCGGWADGVAARGRVRADEPVRPLAVHGRHLRPLQVRVSRQDDDDEEEDDEDEDDDGDGDGDSSMDECYDAIIRRTFL